MFREELDTHTPPKEQVESYCEDECDKNEFLFQAKFEDELNKFREKNFVEKPRISSNQVGLETDIPESVLVSNPNIFEPKSITSINYILSLDRGANNYDYEIIFQTWSYNRDSFYVRIFYDPIHIGGCNIVHKKEVNKDGFLDDPHYIDWVATLSPIRPPPEPPP